MPNILEYVDYRKYLKEVYSEKKARNHLYSYQVMARSAGLRSKSHIAEVISGKKNISDKIMYSLSKSLNLHGRSFAYFKLLVAFDQTIVPEEKQSLFDRISSFNKRNCAKNLLLRQFDFYSAWYHNTVRELVCMVDFKNDFSKLGAMIRPAITAHQARQSVELLLSLGLIRKRGKTYEQTDSIISTGDVLRSVAVRDFHLQNLDIAASSIDRFESNERDISCIVSGLSDEAIKRIKEEIAQMHEKILTIAHDEKAPSRVYHLNFQLFPTSAKDVGKEKR